MSPTQNSTQAVTDTFDALSADQDTRDLAAEARALIAEGEALLQRAGSLTAEAFALARNDLLKQMAALRVRVDELASDAQRRGRIARETADRYIRDNPWRSIAIAAAVGALIGAAISRR